MLEIGILSVILLAAGYWATMFVMGRRDDVIHGKFVHSEDEADTSAVTPASAMPVPLPFPKRPVKTMQPANEVGSVDSAALQSLLAAIQQDLKGVA
jgi:hypothetical protein